MPLHPVVLLEVRVESARARGQYGNRQVLRGYCLLHLMYRRNMRGMIEKVLHLMRAEVGHPNMAGLVLGQQQTHCTPGIHVIDVLSAEPAVLHRPVHMVEVKIAYA